MNRKMKLSFLLLGLGIGILSTNFIYYINPKVEHKDLKDEEIIEQAKDLGMVFVKDTIQIENLEEDKRLPSEEPNIEADNMEEDNDSPLEETYDNVDSIKEDKKSPSKEVSVKADNIKEDKKSSSEKAYIKVDNAKEDKKQPSEESHIDEDKKQPSEEAYIQVDNMAEDETPPSEEANIEESKEENQSVIVFRITKGQSLTAIARNLHNAGLIDDANRFISYSKEKGIASRFQVGTYNLVVGMDYETLITILTSKDS